MKILTYDGDVSDLDFNVDTKYVPGSSCEFCFGPLEGNQQKLLYRCKDPACAKVFQMSYMRSRSSKLAIAPEGCLKVTDGEVV